MFEAVRTVTNTTLPGLKLKVLRRSKSWKSTAGFQFFWGYLWHEAVEWEPVRRPNLQLDIWHLEVVFADLVDRLWIMLPRFASNTSKYTPGHEQQERERENVSQGWVQAMEVLYLLLQGHNQYAYHCRWTLCQYTGTDWTDAKCPESKWRMFGSCFHQLRSQKHAEGLEWSLVTLGLLSSRIPCVCNLPFFVARWNFWNIMRWATDSHPSRGLLKVFCCRKTEMWRCSSGCLAAVTSLWCYECERPTWQTTCWRFEVLCDFCVSGCRKWDPSCYYWSGRKILHRSSLYPGLVAGSKVGVDGDAVMLCLAVSVSGWSKKIRRFGLPLMGPKLLA